MLKNTEKKTGKSTCKKTKSRHCNDPPASNGGVECPGEKKVNGSFLKQTGFLTVSPRK